ncbi:hypothetical protein [Sphaerisporangium fuscum]|uniref:hypothetical protein n=1 Tax=Sphaerisporangium fuscum TaxID=2835868 RepID=UPI001BDD923A|nr:hypothetical protein [Sphaerisporangium fuscum]
MEVAYAWKVVGARRGSCGVTNSCPVAERRLLTALRRIPGGKGDIRIILISLMYTPESYTYGSTLARVRRDEKGIIVADVPSNMIEHFPNLAYYVPARRMTLFFTGRDAPPGGPAL